MSGKKKGFGEELKKATRIVKIWVVLFVVSVFIVGIVLYQGLVSVPFSAIYLTNFDNPDLVKSWDAFKTDQPALNPTALSSPYFPNYGVKVNISETGLLDEIVHPKTIVSFHVSVKTEFLDKSTLKLQSLLVLVLDGNEKVRGKLYTQQSSPDLFLIGNNETDYTFWFRVPPNMQNQKYTIVVELFGVVDTSESINYQRISEDAYLFDQNYGIYGRVPSWSYSNQNSAYFRLLAYDRIDSQTPAVYSIWSLAGYTWTLATASSVLITLLIGLRNRSKEFWKKNKLPVVFCVIFLVLFIIILLLVGLIL
jgi:hypothetical protein